MFTLWAFLAIRVASPMTLFKIVANVAGLVLAIAGVQIFLGEPPLPAARITPAALA